MFSTLSAKPVHAVLDGPDSTSDGGALLLKAADRRLGLVLLDVPESVRLARLNSTVEIETEEEARLRTDHHFRERVRSGYLALGVTTVPAEGTPEEIVGQIVQLLNGRDSA